MTCQAHRSPAPALDADPRAVELLRAARLQNEIAFKSIEMDKIIGRVKDYWARLDKPTSEIAELQAMLNWNQTVRDRLLAMADECDKEFTALDESVRDEAEQALGN